jgi:proteic killer suppression protein
MAHRALECRGKRSDEDAVELRGSHVDRGGSMEVLLETEKLTKQLGQDRNRVKAFGPEGAKRIALRLQQLGAARSLEDMRALPGRCHELKGDLRGLLAVDVHHPYRLIFRPTDNPAPRTPEGGLDWAAVESVTIKEVKDYH